MTVTSDVSSTPLGLRAALRVSSSCESICVSLPALRVDAPARQAYSRGQFPQLGTEKERREAMQRFTDEVYSASSRQSYESRISTTRAMLQLWQLDFPPLDVYKVRVLGATLKAGGYRSASLYLSAARKECERSGFVLGPDVLQALTDAKRSCERGLGPARKWKAYLYIYYPICQLRTLHWSKVDRWHQCALSSRALGGLLGRQS